MDAAVNLLVNLQLRLLNTCMYYFKLYVPIIVYHSLPFVNPKYDIGAQTDSCRE